MTMPELQQGHLLSRLVKKWLQTSNQSMEDLHH